MTREDGDHRNNVRPTVNMKAHIANVRKSDAHPTAAATEWQTRRSKRGTRGWSQFASSVIEPAGINKTHSEKMAPPM
jgi:hypothetical protein